MIDTGGRGRLGRTASSGGVLAFQSRVGGPRSWVAREEGRRRRGAGDRAGPERASGWSACCNGPRGGRSDGVPQPGEGLSARGARDSPVETRVAPVGPIARACKAPRLPFAKTTCAVTGGEGRLFRGVPLCAMWARPGGGGRPCRRGCRTSSAPRERSVLFAVTAPATPRTGVLPSSPSKHAVPTRGPRPLTPLNPLSPKAGLGCHHVVGTHTFRPEQARNCVCQNVLPRGALV